MDFFSSFFQNVKDKLTSPFFGTLAFIILIHHWEFWYTLINFGSKTSLHLKIATLKQIGMTEFHWKNIAEDVMWTVGIMLIGYVIIVGTRSLSLFIDFGIMPWITKKVINKNVVTRSEFEEIILERDNYAEKYEQERKYGRVLSSGYDEQAEQIRVKNKIISENNEQITNLNNNVSKLNSSIVDLNKEISRLKENILSKDGEIESQSDMIEGVTLTNEKLSEDVMKVSLIFFDEENNQYWKHQETFPPTIEKVVAEIKAHGLWEGFKSVVAFEQRGGTIGVDIYSKLEPFGLFTLEDRERLNLLGRIIAANIERFDRKGNIFE